MNAAGVYSAVSSPKTSFTEDACMTFNVNECRSGCEATGLVLQNVKVIPVRCFSTVARDGSRLIDN